MARKEERISGYTYLHYNTNNGPIGAYGVCNCLDVIDIIYTYISRSPDPVGDQSIDQ